MRGKNRTLRHAQNMRKIEAGTLPDPDKERRARRAKARKASRLHYSYAAPDFVPATYTPKPQKRGFFGKVVSKIKNMFRRGAM